MVTFIWNDTYNTEYNISSYLVERIDTANQVECPSICRLTDRLPCQCIRLPSRQTYFRITPKNCNDMQAGQSTIVASCKFVACYLISSHLRFYDYDESLV